MVKGSKQLNMLLNHHSFIQADCSGGEFELRVFIASPCVYISGRLDRIWLLVLQEINRTLHKTSIKAASGG